MMIALNEYPQLKLIAWHLTAMSSVEEEEAFSLYEHNWRFIDQQQLTDRERQLIEYLKQNYGRGFLNV